MSVAKIKNNVGSHPALTLIKCIKQTENILKIYTHVHGKVFRCPGLAVGVDDFDIIKL